MAFQMQQALCAFSFAFVLFSVSGSVDSVEESKRATKLKSIYTLEDNCEGNVCRGFHYDDTDEVAFFDLPPEVRIRDEKTYDIENAEHYDHLWFENSSFAHFPLNLFYSIAVQELDMRNCSVQLLTWENFLMAGNLRILLLSNNSIERIEELTFNYASELQYLFLDSNQLRYLVNESFKGLSKLRYLDLQHNFIEELPSGIFDYLPLLQELNLAHNRLREVNDELFANSPNLIQLMLSSNELAFVSENAFRQVKHFMLFDISNNADLYSVIINIKVTYFTARNCSLNQVNIYGPAANVDLSDNQILELYFSEPEAMEVLNLRNNALEQIASLSRATNLRSLDLADNPDLKTLPDPWTVASLERLNISNIGLTMLPMSSLAETSNLKYLEVSHNKLQEINPRNFKYLEKLRHFNIHGNNWNCYNLNLIMDLLIRPHNILYKRDEFDGEFPGEYINGIACMYRLSEIDLDDSVDESTSQVSLDSLSMSEELSMNQVKAQEEEIRDLRKELKALVQFYESKFSQAFEMIADLSARLAAFERMNETMWQHVTITT